MRTTLRSRCPMTFINKVYWADAHRPHRVFIIILSQPVNNANASWPAERVVVAWQVLWSQVWSCGWNLDRGSFWLRHIVDLRKHRRKYLMKATVVFKGPIQNLKSASISNLVQQFVAKRRRDTNREVQVSLSTSEKWPHAHAAVNWLGKQS